ncbi:MAG TPA: hypothetical protein VEX37_13260 [Thermomicrobiales bacterium]|nr:hypothetical protein [Thermomicrobiales bacterium]
MSDWDITLDGVDYMLAPGSYRAFHEPQAELRTERQRLAGFGAGLNRARPVDGGGLLAGLRAWPAPWPLGDGGIRPAPVSQAVSGSISSSAPKLATSDEAYLYIVAGTTVYRWDRSIGSAPVNRKTLAAAGTCLARLKNTLYIGHGAAADVSLYDDATNALTASALGAGVTASLLGTFSRGLVLVSPSFPMTLHIFYGNSLTYTRSWSLDGTILGFAQLGSRMIVATDAGLYVLSGEWYQDADPPAPPETLRVTSWGTLSGQLQDSDDFGWLIVYQGGLFAWLGKRVVQLDESREAWQPAGLEGSLTHGAAVVNGWLLVSLSPPASPAIYQLWGYNGSGWWLLDETSGTNSFLNPTADGAGRLVTATASSGTLTAWDLGETTTASTLASPFSVTTPPLDGDEPDRPKHWRRAGIELARTDGQPVGDWAAALEYSTDGGTTWTSAGSPTAIATELATVSEPLDVEGATLMLRLTLTRTSGLPPFVTTIWADYDRLDASARRRWQFRILARPRAINRAGTLDPRTGQQIRTALWTLWEEAETVPFRDVDYATTTTERDVRVTAIREEWPKPADANTLGAFSVLELTMDEV